jgi:ABC-type phosphate transport system auxiliary subunit
MALAIPIIALLIPIVAILVRHQQSMAQIIHGSQNQEGIMQLQNDIQELRAQMNQQALLIDNLEGRIRSLPENSVKSSL